MDTSRDSAISAESGEDGTVFRFVHDLDQEISGRMNTTIRILVHGDGPVCK